MVIDISGFGVPSLDGGEIEEEDDRLAPGTDIAVRMLREILTSNQYSQVCLDLASAKGVVWVNVPVSSFTMHGAMLVIDTPEKTLLLDTTEIKVVVGHKRAHDAKARAVECLYPGP